MAISLGEDESRTYFAKDGEISVIGSFTRLYTMTRPLPLVSMPAHLPLLPLTVNYLSKDCIATDDEEGMVFALELHDPIRHWYLKCSCEANVKIVLSHTLPFNFSQISQDSFMVASNPSKSGSARQRIRVRRESEHQRNGRQ